MDKTVLISRLNKCQASLRAVRDCLRYVEGESKAGAVRWAEVVQEQIAAIIKEVDEQGFKC